MILPRMFSAPFRDEGSQVQRVAAPGPKSTTWDLNSETPVACFPEASTDLGILAAVQTASLGVSVSESRPLRPNQLSLSRRRGSLPTTPPRLPRCHTHTNTLKTTQPTQDMTRSCLETSRPEFSVCGGDCVERTSPATNPPFQPQAPRSPSRPRLPPRRLGASG